MDAGTGGRVELMVEKAVVVVAEWLPARKPSAPARLHPGMHRKPGGTVSAR